MIVNPKIKNNKEDPTTPSHPQKHDIRKNPQTNNHYHHHHTPLNKKGGGQQQITSKCVKTLPQDGYSGCWDLDLPYQSPFLQYYSLRPTFPEK